MIQITPISQRYAAGRAASKYRGLESYEQDDSELFPRRLCQFDHIAHMKDVT